MLEIIVPKQELFNEVTNEFMTVEETKLQLEHSLVALRKWESKWHVPFIGREELTVEEMQDYIRCMTLNKNVDQSIYKYIPLSIINKVLDYIGDPMTATWFNRMEGKKGSHSRERVTAEVIYYWMISANVPVEFEKWHLNQLITLLEVISLKSQSPKKMPRREAANQRAALNAARRAKYHTSG